MTCGDVSFHFFQKIAFVGVPFFLEFSGVCLKRQDQCLFSTITKVTPGGFNCYNWALEYFFLFLHEMPVESLAFCHIPQTVCWYLFKLCSGEK